MPAPRVDRDSKRRQLKQAGWRRFDRAGTGERWRHPDRHDAGLGVTLDTAWRTHLRTRTKDEHDGR